MKQIIQSYRNGEVWLAEVPAPAFRSGGAIVRTASSLVSAGTERAILEMSKKSLLAKAQARPDLVKKVISKMKTEGVSQTLEKVFAKLDTPIPLGYSCAGTVVESDTFKPGDRIACGGAGYATHAEFNFVPKNLIVKIPGDVSFEDASFTTLGAIAMQGVRQADVRIGERIAVIGLGLLGLLSVQILKAAGCKVIGCDPDESKCKLAIEFGADQAVSNGIVESAVAFSEGHGVDAVLITAATSSNQPIEDAAEISRAKGRVIVIGVVGMDVPREPFYKKELDLRLSMSYGPGRYDRDYEENGRDYPIGYVRWTEQRNMASFLDLVAAGKVTPAKLVTHRFCIDEALKAYELLESKNEKYLGIVINYPAEAKVSRTIELRPIKATNQIGVGFIGAGNFAKGVLIPTLKKIGGVELVGICTASGTSSATTAKKHDFAYATTDAEKLLSDSRVNTVFIATPHDSHAEFLIDALSAGKHVFVEKPLCVTSEELQDCGRAIEASDKCVTVGFNRRFSPHTQAIRQVFASRGTPMFISYRVNAGPAADIVGEVCHFVDFCEFVTGSTPAKVHAESLDNSASITIRYADGSIAAIQYVSIGPGGLAKERVEVFAGGIAAVLDDFVTTTFHGCKRASVKTKQDKGFAGELSAFLQGIRGGERPIDLNSILRTTRVTFAILDSLRLGKPIEVA